MFLSEKEIVDYHENLISKIDLIHEKKKLKCENYKDEVTDTIDRNAMISKLKEIESFNLEQCKSNFKKYKFCYVIQNKLAQCSITGKIRRTIVVLLVCNIFLEEDLVIKLR